MASYIEFLAKTIHLPATAPTLAALSLAGLAAGQLHDRFSPSEANASPGQPDQSDESRPDAASGEEGLSPAVQVAPEPNASLEFAHSFLPETIIPIVQTVEKAGLVPSLGIPLPPPVKNAVLSTPVPQPPTTVAVAPELVQSALSESLGYQNLLDQSDRNNQNRSLSATPPPRTSLSLHGGDLTNHWSQPYVMVLAELGIVQGLPDGRFEPDRPITRAELADLLQRSFSSSALSLADISPANISPANISKRALTGSPRFQDVSAKHWAAASIDRAYLMGLFPETEANGFFHPDFPASRRVTWGAIVQGLDLSSSRQHGALMQAWQLSLSHPVGQKVDQEPEIQESPQTNSHDTNSHDTNSQGMDATLAELNLPITRAETIALLYHALTLSNPELGDRLARANSVLSAGEVESLTLNFQATNPATADQPSVQSLPAEKQQALDPSQGSQGSQGSQRQTDRERSGLGSADILINPPLLVAANMGGDTVAIEPLLAPMPPPLTSNTERLDPEFSPALPVLAQGGSPSRSSVESALLSPNPSAPLPATDVNETYTLGAGDRIFVEVFGLPQYSQEYQVLVDGSLNLPRAGRMVVEGMSLAQTEALIYGQYSRYYRQPATSVVLVQPRSLQIAITGAVNRPGVYRLSPEGGSQFPSVTQAIQEAGGIGAKANLRNVELQRAQRDGSLQTLEVNLWELLQSGNLSQDISLRDGDRLRIPEAQALTPEELSKISTANFSPETIEVSVVGSATEAPGTLQVSPNTPLSQVVLAAGGFNDRKESRLVSLVRLHPNGTVEQRQIEVPLSGEVNENTNPILQHQDVVILDRSKGAIARERATGFLGNLLRVIPFFSFF